MVERATGLGAAGQALSVVLPNYNHARYLPRALDALLSQDRPADEIIVVDDGSLDNSREIVARYAAENSSVRLLANAKNLGVIATLSRGFNAARGQYVYFAAADDFVVPGFFSSAIKTLMANPRAGLFCGEVSLVDGYTGLELGVRPPVRPRYRAGFINPAEVARLLRRNDNFIVTGAAVLRRDAVVWAGAFDEQLSSFADGYLVRKIAFTFGFCYTPSAVLTWNIFPDSVSHKTSTEIGPARRVLSSVEKRMVEDPVFPGWYCDVFARRWRFATCRLAIRKTPVNSELLMGMGAQNSCERALYRFILGTFSAQIASFFLMAYLFLRFRPISLVGLASTALVRRLYKTRSICL